MPSDLQATEYRDRRLVFPVFGTLFGSGGIAVWAIGIPDTIAQGGLQVGLEDSNVVSLWPLPWGALALFTFSLPFVAVGLWFWLYYLKNVVVVDSQGIRSTNFLGKEDFRARWTDILEVRDAKWFEWQATKIRSSTCELRIYCAHPHWKEIVSDVLLMSGRSPS